VDAWTVFFDALINGASDAAAVATSAIETYFQKNPAKAAGIRMALIKQELLIDQYARKK
jgi:hypothetical protein